MFLTDTIEIRRTRGKGRGVFATADIPPGSLIGDYLGMVLPADSNMKEHPENAVYDMWFSDLADICPDPKEEGTHLINASCEPNCAMHPLGRHTVIFALRKIFEGEELTYDYFLGEQDEDCDPGTDNCHCNSPFCRGTMYSNPKAYREWEEYLEEVIGDEPEEPPVSFGAKLPPLPSYPEMIEDHPIYPLWGTRKRPPLACGLAVFRDAAKLRSTMRETGRRLSFPELGIAVEGMMHGEQLVARLGEPRKRGSALRRGSGQATRATLRR
jgi:uncharacterized protein